MPEIEFLVDQLRRIHDGPAWHGPSVRDALTGLTAAQAQARPLPGTHTIAELTHHLAAWTGEVTRRLHGGSPAMPPEGDFPTGNKALTEAEWESLVAQLTARHREMLEAVSELAPARLGTILPPTADNPESVPISIRGMLNGLLQHDAYHAGQLMLLRRAQGA